MAADYKIKIPLSDERMKKIEEAGLGGSIKDKVIEVPMPQKNKRKFLKAFPGTECNEDTCEIKDFPDEAMDLLIDTIVEHKMLEVMHLFLMKAFKPLAGKEVRRSIHHSA
ncbi:MAG: hypothetical protein JXB42_06165 [Deltaproteobacteria bacterium]|nr:hypothetical protein [Deltaproteobacteria bacterium]